MRQPERLGVGREMNSPFPNSRFPIPIAALFDLLEETFPGVEAARARAQEFGATWESVSTPFVVEERGRIWLEGGGRILGTLGWRSIRLGSEDGRGLAGGVPGVPTGAGLGRQGLFRSLMERLLPTPTPAIRPSSSRQRIRSTSSRSGF